MSEAQEFEELVEAIATRVRSRLGMQSPASSNECLVCGINPQSCVNPDQLASTSEPSQRQVAGMIDHTLLKPEADRAQIEELCAEAKQHGFFSVCVNSSMVHLAKANLHGSSVKVCAVIGFPLGAGTPGAKAYEAREAVRCGADEIDMVINIGALKSFDYSLVEYDIAKIVKAVQPKIVKVILETGHLCDTEKIIGCTLAKAAKAHFVKTSTGFGRGGATVEDIKLMRRVVGPDMGVKASGGVHDYQEALGMVRAGATRLGCSASVTIVTGGRSTGAY